MKNPSGALAVPAATIIGFELTAMGATQAKYGWMLFLGVPFLTGYVAVLIYVWSKPRTIRQCLWISLWPFIGVTVLLLSMGVEGLICIAMEAVLAVPLGLLGGLVAWRMHGRARRIVSASALM